MHVIGTAGHVDHGKSTLIQALTGIDPDRLREEKERGMTIDLGFAWLQLPSGEEVSIVDVPGHERFIKNMLAGVGGIDLAVLVIAADEGVMPQTREHLAILDLLRVNRGIAVVTKSDLVEPDFLELVMEEVREVLAPTTLADAEIVAASAYTRDGLDDLTALLDRMLQETPQRPDRGRPRLPIDRSFSISGFGTVVTGTLIDGALSVGQEIVVVPGDQKVRIRGLQSHQKKEERIVPGTRTAANITGVDADEVSRGQVLTTPGWLKPTNATDVRLRMIANAPGNLRHNLQVTFHWMAAESLARVRLLDADRLEPGDEGWCQIVLETPLPLVKGDFFVVRTSVGTLGGGEVVETDARRHKRNDPELISRLEALAGGDPQEVVQHTLETESPIGLSDLARRAALPEEEARELVQTLVDAGDAIAFGEVNPALLYSRGGWDTLKAAAHSHLKSYHTQYQLRKGAPREELRSRLRVPADVFTAVVARFQEENVLVEEGTILRLQDHNPQLPSAAQRQADDLLRQLRGSPYAPPTDVKVDPEVLGFLTDGGQVVAVSEGIVYAADAYQEQIDKVIAHIKDKGSITVAETRDLLGTSRKYVLPLLESMDERHITRRVGDDRVLL